MGTLVHDMTLCSVERSGCGEVESWTPLSRCFPPTPFYSPPVPPANITTAMRPLPAPHSLCDMLSTTRPYQRLVYPPSMQPVVQASPPSYWQP